MKVRIGQSEIALPRGIIQLLQRAIAHVRITIFRRGSNKLRKQADDVVQNLGLQLGACFHALCPAGESIVDRHLALVACIDVGAHDIVVENPKTSGNLKRYLFDLAYYPVLLLCVHRIFAKSCLV